MGFGARIAMRLSLGYPDVFRGALLNAGSDPIGDGASPLPPKDLFLQFQNSTRLVYVTGAADSFHIGMDEDSMRSVRKWCVFNLDDVVTPSVGHEVADQGAFSLALAAMLKPSQTDPGKLVPCRAAVEAELARKFQKAESAIANGDRRQAKKILNEIDARYGGVAAPRSIELTQSPDFRPPARDSAGL
jgi:pimeloyl-ACP methyl ester carboxylesterase